MANTSVLIKRSIANSKPATLQAGELAYSYLSNTIFIGNSTGTGTINIGGGFYTSQLDNATSSNVASTIVKRDANGAFGGTFNGLFTGVFNGTINTANSLASSQNFSISGSDITATAVSFNGTAPVTLNAALNAVPGLTAGTYGGVSAVPVLTIAANGRVIAVSNASINSSNQSFTLAGNTGSSVFFTGNTLSIVGAAGITTSVSGSQVIVLTDTTVLRTNTTSVGVQTISSDVIMSGNVTFLNPSAQINIFSTTVAVGDSLIQLGSNNVVGDVVDSGFYSAANTGAAVVYSGLIREGSGGSSAGNFFLFKNLPTNPTGNTVTYASLQRANLVANLTGGVVSGLAAAILVGDGGTGATTFTSGQILVGNGTGALNSLANSTFTPTGTGAANSTVSSLTVDAYGRLTAATFSAISGLTVGQGGTGNTTFGVNGVVFGNGTGALASIVAGVADITYSNQILTVDNTGLVRFSGALDGGQF